MQSRLPRNRHLARLSIALAVTAGCFFAHLSIAAESDVEVASTSSSGELGDGGSGRSSITARGRVVAFHSDAGNLVEGDENGQRDVFTHSFVTNRTRRVSVTKDGTQGNDESFDPAISGNGLFVVFSSNATNFIKGDQKKFDPDVFIYSFVTGRMKPVSVDAEGKSIGGRTPSISASGRFVAFEDRNGRLRVVDRKKKKMQTIKNSTDGARAEGGTPTISPNGRVVVFQSGRPDIVAGDTNLTADVFAWERRTGSLEMVSVSSDGELGNGTVDFGPYGLSRDGSLIAFGSFADNLAPGATAEGNVYVRDRDAGTTELGSIDSDGVGGNGVSLRPMISRDGKVIVFYSRATNLVPVDENDFHYDVFFHNRKTGVTRMVSRGADGQAGNHDSFEPAFAEKNKRFVAFHTSASNLFPGDDNGKPDVLRVGGRPSR